MRSLVKLAGVVLAAGLVGAGLGIGLAKLTGSEESSAPEAGATSEPATATTAATQTATTAPPPTPVRAPYREPRFEVRFARLGTPASDTGRATVTASIGVTNRNAYALKPRPPVLISEGDELPLDTDGDARDAAGPLLRAIGPGDTATGELRFTVAAAVAQRLSAGGSVRLGIAGRTIGLRLTNSAAVE